MVSARDTRASTAIPAHQCKSIRVGAGHKIRHSVSATQGGGRNHPPVNLWRNVGTPEKGFRNYRGDGPSAGQGKGSDDSDQAQQSQKLRPYCAKTWTGAFPLDKAANTDRLLHFVNVQMDWLSFLGLSASLCSLAIGLYELHAKKPGAFWFFFLCFLFLVIFGYSLWNPAVHFPSVGSTTPAGSEISNPPAESTAPPVRQQEIEEPLPPIKLRKIHGLAYSYSKDSWAAIAMGGSYFPEVGLWFTSGFVTSYAAIDWHGSYEVSNRNTLCLTVDNLRVPTQAAFLADRYADFGVGYGVELDNAVFEDHSISRVVMLYRSFLGDSAPPEVKKCFKINAVEPASTETYKMEGEWDGECTDSTESPASVLLARIEQTGNRFHGVLVTDGHLKAETTFSN